MQLKYSTHSSILVILVLHFRMVNGHRVGPSFQVYYGAIVVILPEGIDVHCCRHNDDLTTILLLFFKCKQNWIF